MEEGLINRQITESDRDPGTQTHIRKEKETDREGDRETGRQGDRQTGRQADRETERHRDTETERQRQSFGLAERINKDSFDIITRK